MIVSFITGNKNKFDEVRRVIPGLEQLDLDLPEIQAIDPRAIIKAKLVEALNHHAGPFIVEDTSLYLQCLGGLPGPLIKWFMQGLGCHGIYDLARRYDNYRAEAKTIIGYAKSHDEILFFEGAVSGIIVVPASESAFGWDPIFQPDGFGMSFAQMSREDKNKISMRGIAAQKLKDYLENNA